MSALLTAIFAMVNGILPLIGTGTTATATIESIISVLTGAIPFIVTEVSDVVPAFKNVIAALSDNPATDATQLATLQALDAQVDAAFDAAAAQTDADTAAASNTGTTSAS